MCPIKDNFMGQNRQISSAEIESLAKEPYLVSTTLMDTTDGVAKHISQDCGYTKLHHDIVVNRTYWVTGTTNTLKW
jgi:hypothetical protein